ncbi:hypothetical protein [Heyndrickxia sporothermodurans]|uniref:hypothetical protein n=1 Tax=Heyndrickxia sporothermodurans TaxID=46224 RepID=UPI002E1DE829|nr:hypothetical protein [Heyndrickxia sporothermodurans]MED3697966.1 hypothetical protein [Heyndrickxia sporothermodurans]
MTKVLYVYGDGDYDVLSFNNNYNPQKVYEEMVAEGITKKDLLDPEWDEESIHVEIKEFGEVDSEFVSFMYNEFIDYDVTKAKDIFFVEEVVK